VGLVDTGLADMANKWLDVLLEFRIGGFSVQTWLLAAWDQVQIGWARVKNFIVDTLDRLWQNFKAVATYVGGVFAAPFQAMSDAFLWVLEQFAKGLDWLSDKFSGWYDQMAMGMIELARLTGFMDEEMARQSSALIRSGQVTAANNDFTGAVQEWRQSNREFWADLETQSDQGLLSLLREAGETADENARRRDEDMQAVIEAIESGMQRRFEADFETPETPSRRRRVDDAFLLGEMGTAGSVGTFGGMAAAQILGTDIDRRLLKTNQEQLGALRQIERNTGAKISF
jgi:hypothetical protein